MSDTASGVHSMAATATSAGESSDDARQPDARRQPRQEPGDRQIGHERRHRQLRQQPRRLHQGGGDDTQCRRQRRCGGMHGGRTCGPEAAGERGRGARLVDIPGRDAGRGGVAAQSRHQQPRRQRVTAEVGEEVGVDRDGGAARQHRLHRRGDRGLRRRAGRGVPARRPVDRLERGSDARLSLPPTLTGRVSTTPMRAGTM